ncbi:hypothetical protein BDZ94DRAFT_542554 [Collybia nuda]|uniref:Uncharacterized protein n=1 Tax=Collybia nuda TaxID=64659 RepID=A0A9P5YH08_9AGAR|nr:hypothetical protein BDZ94DRAFT_542554 [Collybia nuda]
MGVTMGIRSMPWDEWIELDNQFEIYHRIRAHRIRTRGMGAICVLPDNPGVVESGATAAVEVVHELAEYLSRRYPTTFKVSRHLDDSPDAISSKYGWEGARPIRTITIIPLSATYDIPLNTDESRAAERALEVAALIIQEDLALMIEGSDGRYYFQAGAICIPGFWRMQDKIGLPLDEIHITGDVPKYREKLEMSMGRFFQRLAVEKPVARNNYSLQVLDPRKPQSSPINTVPEVIHNLDDEEEIDFEELAWSTSANGPENSFIHGGHRVRGPQEVLVPAPSIANVRLRSERQTLRRLPLSGAIVFTIRTYLTPIQTLGQEPGVPGRLASALRGWGRNVSIYKGKERGNWWNVVLEYLDSCWNEQLAQGTSLEGGGKENYPL